MTPVPARGRCPVAEPSQNGHGTPTARWHWLLHELETRFPDPQPYESTTTPEQRYLAAIDGLLAQRAVLVPLDRRGEP